METKTMHTKTRLFATLSLTAILFGVSSPVRAFQEKPILSRTHQTKVAQRVSKVLYGRVRKKRIPHTSAAKLQKPSSKRGQRAFSKTCTACHSTALQFQNYTGSQIKGAQRSIPDMKYVKVSAQQVKDLVAYFKTVS